MPRRRETPLTDEQLRLGLRQLWRPGWPEDLTKVLADPVRGKLVQGMARQLSRQQATAPGTARPNRTPAHAAPVPPTPQHPPAPRGTHRVPRHGFDAKRAAANDFDA